eukprot:scaffold22412_cov83-Skeletonema_dohrnii-CCMP3373.AAC.1
MVHTEVETSATPVLSYAPVWVRRTGKHKMSSRDDIRTRPGTRAVGVWTLVLIVQNSRRVTTAYLSR